MLLACGALQGRDTDTPGRQLRGVHQAMAHLVAANRAAGVHQLDLYPQPPRARDEGRDPWPTWPWILREYPAHEEGGERVYAVAVQEFVDDAPERCGRCGSPR